MGISVLLSCITKYHIKKILKSKGVSYMNLLFQEMTKRREYLEELETEIAKILVKSPEGKLRVSKCRGLPSYYHIIDAKDTRGKYLPKKEPNVIWQLAQKDYLQKLQKEVKEELSDIEMYLSRHGEKQLEEIYESLNEYRKKLVIPWVITDEMYVEQWKKEAYETNPYYQEEKVYQTKNDELVRSKSEMLLADMYYELGIPYRYEAQLLLKTGKKKYPDFTLLNPKTREVIYHEHLGLMSNEEYRQSNMEKLDEYRRNGIFFGKNLFVTYEGEGSYLNIREIKKMVKEIMKSN